MSLHLGVLEEIILIILLSKEETYGFDIAVEYESQFNQTISLPAIHVVLKRLEKKDLVSTRMGEPTQERGGKRKRLYKATSKGYEAARTLQEKRTELWKGVPSFNVAAQ
ncbi:MULTISPECIES: PadR family transcriptional regulator [unclassified Imperialibacter]|jgi:DNA-binding PadR family transcriptional regulator|uniref:PadR family transcriptional regulator n=1 Tax=unclassified Imperialibacter TaxID=2629706 RepID=UPI001259751C|nr:MULTISPECIES: PadR family transcriptional regulator [unclassified Imperialibacter]CAD5250630.1 PadR family transcriptional regulator [Imperialibacter sp. 75]CAD5286282.1 PadR family transcriptional regulator [Imperialibacter sp. 89]VVT05416.1 PadR family transcriptional regulator [Imperialibacter sp. EC-SDR9]